MAEGVPDAGALAVLGGRPLDLVRRSAGTEPEARWKQRVRHGDHCVGDRSGSKGNGPVLDPRSGTSDASLVLVRVVLRPRARLVRSAVRAQRRPARRPAPGTTRTSTRDVVLVTWVVSGALAHEDDSRCVDPAGRRARGHPSRHRHHPQRARRRPASPASSRPGCDPSEPGGEPSRRTTTPDLSGGALVVVGRRGRPRRPRSDVADRRRCPAARPCRCPTRPLRYVFVATGALTRSSLAEPLAAGDAFEITGDHERRRHGRLSRPSCWCGRSGTPASGHQHAGVEDPARVDRRA